MAVPMRVAAMKRKDHFGDSGVNPAEPIEHERGVR